MQTSLFSISGTPAVLYGESAPDLWLYVHGKCGCKEEAESFADIACPTGAQVLALDLPEHGARAQESETCTPWNAVPELQEAYQFDAGQWHSVSLRATSLGAWFSLLALEDAPLRRALLVSAVLDMERLIRDMMLWAAVDDVRLKTEGEISTTFGETLSWRYLQYASSHRIAHWRTPTAILYPALDNLTGRETAEEFCRRFGCTLTVLDGAEHYLHTPGELSFLRAWEQEHLQ